MYNNQGLNGFWGWFKKALNNVGSFLKGKGLIASLIGEALVELFPLERSAQTTMPAQVEAKLNQWMEDSFKPLLEIYTAWVETTDLRDFADQEYISKYNTVLRLFSTLKAYYESKHKYLTGLDFQLWEEQMSVCAGVVMSFEGVYLTAVEGTNPSTRLELEEYDPSYYTEVGDIPLDWSHVTSITATTNQIIGRGVGFNPENGGLPKPTTTVPPVPQIPKIKPIPNLPVVIDITSPPIISENGGIVLPPDGNDGGTYQSPPFNPNTTVIIPEEQDPPPSNKNGRKVAVAAVAIGVLAALFVDSSGKPEPKKKKK